jgi:hypothetical protein
MRLLAALILAGVAVVVGLAVVGTLPWMDGALPLLIAWVSLTSLAMHWLDTRATGN